MTSDNSFLPSGTQLLNYLRGPNKLSGLQSLVLSPATFKRYKETDFKGTCEELTGS